jgi:hypothetical protein
MAVYRSFIGLRYAWRKRISCPTPFNPTFPPVGGLDDM